MTSIVSISLSEISKVFPSVTTEWVDKNYQEFKKILWELGGDIYKPFERQQGLIHRNRFNEVVECDRWVLAERLDKDWTDTPYCSREAKNDSSGSNLLKDLDPYKYHKL